MSQQDCTTCKHEGLDITSPPCTGCQELQEASMIVNYLHWTPHRPQEQPGIYMVSVTGRRAPEKRHPSLAEARAEAERLVRQDHASEVLVLCLVDVARASVEWEGRPW